MLNKSKLFYYKKQTILLFLINYNLIFMTLISNIFVKDYKQKNKYLVDNMLRKLEDIPARVESIRVNENNNSKIGIPLKQTEFSHLLDLSPQNYNRMKRAVGKDGINIPLQYLVKLHAYSGIPLEYIILGETSDIPAHIDTPPTKDQKRLIETMEKAIDLLERENEYLRKENEELKSKLREKESIS